MLLLLPFVCSSLLLPAGRCVRLPASSRIARSSAFRARNSFPNGPARPVAVNAGSATQVGLAAPKAAARAGKVGALLDSGRTVERGEGPNGRQRRRSKNGRIIKEWPLEDAIIGQNVEMVKALLEAGASLEAQEGSSYSPLMKAIVYGYANVDVVKVLLEAGASLEAEPPGGKVSSTPLGSAVRRKNVEVIKALIDAGASLEDGGAFANTPLEIAIRGGDVEVVQTLVDAGVSLEAPAGGPWFTFFTPLESALGRGVSRGDVEAIKVLLEASLTTNLRRRGLAITLIWTLIRLAGYAYPFAIVSFAPILGS